MATTTKQQLNIPAELLNAIMAAKQAFTWHKATVKLYDPGFTSDGEPMQGMSISFLDQPQSQEQAKSVWASLRYTLWGKDVARIGDYLQQFANEKGSITLFVAYDINDVWMKPYKDGSGRTTPTLRWVAFLSSEFLLTLGKRSEEEVQEDTEHFVSSDDDEEEM